MGGAISLPLDFMFRLSKPSQQAFLAFLLALTLLGAQAVKDSPWHDHATHAVDCALCHLQAFEADLPPAPPAPPVFAPVAGLSIAPAWPTASPIHSPYHSRAPPAFL